MTDRVVFVPEGLPARLTLSQVAAVLAFEERTVRGWLERGVLPFVQAAGRNGWRYVSPLDVAVFAAVRGLKPDWDVLMND